MASHWRSSVACCTTENRKDPDQQGAVQRTDTRDQAQVAKRQDVAVTRRGIGLGGVVEIIHGGHGLLAREAAEP
jgi:hypothetical protein